MRLFLLLVCMLSVAACDDIEIESFESVRGVTVADLDGDGRPDVALASALVRGGGSAPGRVWVFLQDPAAPGAFFLGEWFGVGFEPQEVVAADLDGDAFLDLAVTNLHSDSVSVLLQDPANPGVFPAEAQWATGPLPTDLAVGDLDADGLPDLVVSAVEPSLGYGVPQILFQDPAFPGEFLAPAFLDLGTENAALIVTDFDGDTRQDLLATMSPDRDVPGSVDVLLQDPMMPGSFLDLGSTATGIQPLDLVAAPLDGDGFLDVVTADLGAFGRTSSAGVSVLLQDPMVAGALLPATQFQAGVSPHGVSVGDLDGDLIADIAAVSSFEVTLWFQDPAARGTFVLGARLPVLRVAGGLDLADMDADGALDVVVADAESVVIHFQDAAVPGTFFPPVVLAR